MHASRSGRQVEHVTATEQSFGAVGIKNGTRVDFRRNPERNACGEVGFDQASDHVHRRPLRGQHQVNADGARHLCQAGDGFFDIASVEHHQIGKFVDDDDDVGNRALFGIFGKQAARGVFIEQLVVLIDIADTFFRQQLQAALHFADGVAQRIGCEFWLGNDRRVQMRHTFVIAKLQPFGINQHQPHLVGGRFIQNRHDHGVNRHALAGSG